jgi:hypothetical protein
VRKLVIPRIALVLLLPGPGGHARAQTPPAGMGIEFSAGWNVVSLPAGTNLSGVQGPLYTLQPGDTSYEAVQPSQGTKNGVGYWAYFPAPTLIYLGAGSTAPMQVSLPAGQWVMLGDPSGTGDNWATISGIDATYHYDSQYGWLFGLNCSPRCTIIAPAEGVFVYSAAGGTATITVMPPPNPGPQPTSSRG